jgi:hypothetical protein
VHGIAGVAGQDVAVMMRAPGDARPCVRPSCPGIMRYGRASENCAGREDEGIVKILSTSACPDPLGWICSEDAGHFRVTDSRLLTLVKR